jgi:hypothetical protein
MAYLGAFSPADKLGNILLAESNAARAKLHESDLALAAPILQGLCAHA